MYRIMYIMKPELNGQLPLFNGYILYASYLSLIQREKPQIAKDIHQSKRISPIAITPLRPIERKVEVTQGFMKIRTDTRYKTSITVLDDSLEEIIDIIGKYGAVAFKLGLIPFNVTEMHIERTTYSRFVKQNIKHSSIVRLKFITPTQLLLRNSKPVILPIPELIFSNLARIWNAFSEIKLDLTSFYDWVESNVYIREVNIISREFDFGKKVKIAGFKGHVMFRMREGSYLNWVHILSKFSEYSNVGTKRSFGMGVTVVLEGKKVIRPPELISPYQAV